MHLDILVLMHETETTTLWRSLHSVWFYFLKFTSLLVPPSIFKKNDILGNVFIQFPEIESNYFGLFAIFQRASVPGSKLEHF